jgi:uncharacterized membrane protein
VPILLFLVYVAVVIFFTFALGYWLTAEEEPTVSGRCHKAQEMHRRRQTRRQRTKCRFEI